MKTVFILVLLFTFAALVPASDTLFDRTKVQKESVEFLSKENAKGFKIGMACITNNFIYNKMLKIRDLTSSDKIIQDNYLELLLINLKSCYILIGRDYSDVDLSKDYSINDPQFAIKIKCLNLLDLGRMIFERFIRESVQNYTRDEIKKDIIPMVKSYSEGLPELPSGLVNYFEKMVTELSKKNVQKISE